MLHQAVSRLGIHTPVHLYLPVLSVNFPPFVSAISTKDVSLFPMHNVWFASSTATLSLLSNGT